MKDYILYIKKYFKYTCSSTKNLFYMVLSTSFSKIFVLILPIIASLIIKYLSLGNFSLVYFLIFIYALVYMFYMFAEWVNYEVYTRNMEECYIDLQNKILSKLLKVDSSFSKKITKAKLINYITVDTSNVGDMLDNISEFITTFIQIIFLLIIIWLYNYYLSLIILIYIVIYLIITIKSDKYQNIYFKRVKKDEDKYSHLLFQTTTGLSEVKSFNMLDGIKKKLNNIQNTFIKHYKLRRKYIQIRDNDVNFVTVFFKIILYIISFVLIINHGYTVDLLILVVSYFEYLEGFLYEFLQASSSMRENYTSLDRVNKILNYRNEIEEIYGDYDQDNIRGIVEFKNVSYNPKNSNKGLKNISFKAHDGKVLTIVGPSGSGKTTIFNLLLRLAKPNKGSITIDNVDIYKYSKKVYSSNVAITSEKPFIFNMSIKRNLDMVDSNIENQIEACKKVGVHDFIMSLPHGYNTVLRENATNISSTQKQLISIARMLLSKSEIILLDDITVSLDSEIINMLPKILKELKEDHTIIMITKKKKLMEISDKIVILDQGRIVDSGTHKELIKRSSLYRDLNAYRSPSRTEVFEND